MRVGVGNPSFAVSSREREGKTVPLRIVVDDFGTDSGAVVLLVVQ